jgi:hypothetical protein
MSVEDRGWERGRVVISAEMPETRFWLVSGFSRGRG